MPDSVEMPAPVNTTTWPLGCARIGCTAAITSIAAAISERRVGVLGAARADGTRNPLQTQPLLDYYEAAGKLHRVDGSRSVEEVGEQIRRVLS